MECPDWIVSLFAALDAKNVDQFCAPLADDCHFIFANMPAVEGKQNIYDFVDGFVGTIDHCHHELHETHELADGLLVRGQVNYTRLDDTTLSVPFANVFEIDDDNAIAVYQIYVDNHEL